jgi:hypothetical protein
MFDGTVKACNQEVKPKFDGVFEARVIGPLKKQRDKLTEVNNGIKLRNKACLDYDVARRQVRSLIAKPPQDGSVLQQAEVRQGEMQSAYEKINAQMITRLETVLEQVWAHEHGHGRVAGSGRWGGHDLGGGGDREADVWLAGWLPACF